MTAKAEPKSTWPLFVLMSLYLIFFCVWRLVVPANEYGAPGGVYLDIALKAAITIAIVVAYRKLIRSPDFSGGKRSLAGLLLVVGVISGVVLLLLRLISDHGWWTGHLNYSLGS